MDRDVRDGRLKSASHGRHFVVDDWKFDVPCQRITVSVKEASYSTLHTENEYRYRLFLPIASDHDFIWLEGGRQGGVVDGVFQITPDDELFIEYGCMNTERDSRAHADSHYYDRETGFSRVQLAQRHLDFTHLDPMRITLHPQLDPYGLVPA